MSKPTQYAHVIVNVSDNSGLTVNNILWFELIGTFGGGYDIAAAATALSNHIQTTLLPCLSADAFFNGIDVRINNVGVSSDASTYPAISGTAAAGTIPNEVAAIVHWQTSQPGGSGRGRSYLTLFPAAFCAGGRLTTGASTVFNAYATALKTAFVDQGISWQLRLYSRSLDTMYPIVSFVVDRLVGTQRRRRPPR